MAHPGIPDTIRLLTKYNEILEASGVSIAEVVPFSAEVTLLAGGDGAQVRTRRAASSLRQLALTARRVRARRSRAQPRTSWTRWWTCSTRSRRRGLLHLTGIMQNFRTVQLFDYTSGSVAGVLQTLAAMLSEEWLGPLATHGGRYILLNADIAVYNRVMKIVHTSTPWEEDEALLQLLRTPDTQGKLMARIERLQTNLEVLKMQLGKDAGVVGTNKRVVAFINEQLREAAGTGEKAPRVTETTISRLLNNKYNWNGPALKHLEHLFAIIGDAGVVAGEEEYMPDEEEGAEHAGPVAKEVEEEGFLPRFRQLVTTHLLPTSDTFHVGATYAKVVYSNYRGFVFKALFAKLFKRGKALRTRKLVQLRFIFLVLRLAAEGDVAMALQDWYEETLAGPSHAADPRCEALVTLLNVHLPLLALWERALLHGPVSTLQEPLPLICLVRAWQSPPHAVVPTAAHLQRVASFPHAHAQAFHKLGSVSYAKNALAMACTWERIKQLNPDLYKIFENEIHACSSESLETAHSAAAAGRQPGHTIRFEHVRQIWVNITCEMQSSIALERGFRCAARAPRRAAAALCAPQRAPHARRAALCPFAPASGGRYRGRTHRYTSRPTVDADHPLVARAQAALLDLIRNCRAERWETATGAPAKTVLFRDPVVGLFSEHLLLPDFAGGVATATALLAAQKAEWRKPLGPWRTRIDVDEETGEPQPDADEAPEEEAGKAEGEAAGTAAGTAAGAAAGEGETAAMEEGEED